MVVTKNRFFASKVLIQIFCAMLLVIVIMFASNYWVYKNSLNSIYSQVSENNRSSVTHMIQSFDNSFKDINDVIYSIQMLPYDSWNNPPNGEIDMTEVYKLYKDIAELVTSISYVENVVVYRKDFNLGITAVGTTSLENLFQQQYNNKTYNLAFWKSLANTRHMLQVFPAQWYGGAANMSRNLIAISGNNQLSDVNILVLVDTNKLLQYVNQNTMLQSTSLIVLDQNRNIILNTEPDWDLVDAFKELAVSAGAETTVKKKDYEYTLFKSTYNDFTYINKTPYEFGNMNAVSTVNRHIIISAIACAVVISVLLSLILYRPIWRLFALIGGQQGRPDLRFMRNRIKSILIENDSLNNQLLVLRQERLANLFLRALGDRAPASDEDSSQEAYYAEIFKDDYFLLFSFHLHPHPGHEQAPLLRAEEEMAIIRSKLEHKFAAIALFRQTSTRYVALISLSRPTEREQTVKQLRGVLKQAKKEMSQGCAVQAEVSRLYASKPANLYSANEDLVRCLAYRNVDEQEPLTDYQGIRFTWKVHFPLEEIEKAAYCLMRGDEAECVRIVDEILKENVNRHVHYHQIVPLAQMIFYHLLKLLESSDIAPGEMLEMKQTFTRRLEAAYRYQMIRDALIQAIGSIAEKNRSRKDKLHPETVALYIERNHMNNLHLEHMADMMGTTSKYFSNYFKKTFNVNFVEYLNKVRLSHAKELLRKTDIPVAEIGIRTGYLSASTFASTFQKYVGVSPSEYRRRIRTEQSQ